MGDRALPKRAPLSKARVTGWVTAWQWRPLRDALAAEPRWKDPVDERKRNLLHLCCSVDPERRDLPPAEGVKTADVLLDAGFDVDREAFSEGAWRATPLWYAISRGENLVLARHLLDRGASPENCLWSAAFREDLAAIRLLAERGATIDAVAEDETPFLAAVKWSHFRAAEMLLRLGADPNFQDSRGMTALHYMLKKGSPEKHFHAVLAHGARGDLPSRDGVTAAGVMARKRSPGFREMAAQLASTESPAAVAGSAGAGRRRSPPTRAR
jgi:hypothetical protein